MLLGGKLVSVSPSTQRCQVKLDKAFAYTSHTIKCSAHVVVAVVVPHSKCDWSIMELPDCDEDRREENRTEEASPAKDRTGQNSALATFGLCICHKFMRRLAELI